MDSTWKVTEREVGNVTTANFERNGIRREGDLGLLCIDLHIFQELA